MPRFSVIIPVYNRGQFVKKAIESILAQTNSDYELIVVDDGSTDDTVDVIKSYGEKVKLIRQPNQGPEVARNTGAAIAKGEYFAFLDSDDLMLPWALETYERVIISQGHPAIILSNLKFFDESHPIDIEGLKDNKIKIVKYENFLSKDRTLRTSVSIIVVNRVVFNDVHGFRNSSPTTYYYDDLDFILRVGMARPAVLILSPAVIAYRVHQSNIIHNIEFNYRGIKSIIQAEKKGSYPGGPLLRFKRYAFIGGPAYFSCKKALSHGYPLFSIRILIAGFFMILAGVIRQVSLRMHDRIQPVTLNSN